jgi:hypothetical protein
MSTGRRLVQCRGDFTEVPGVAALDAALPWGGIKTGTTKADRIIKTAKPTSTSTIVKCQIRLVFFILAFLSLSHWVRAIPFPDWRKYFLIRNATTT